MGRGPIPQYGSFKKKPTGKGAGQGCNSTNEVELPVKTHQYLPWSYDRIPRRLTVWAQSCQTHSGKAVGHLDGSVQEQSPLTTLGLQAQDPLAVFLALSWARHKLLKRKTMEVSLSHPWGHSTHSPLMGWSLGGGGALVATVNLQKSPLHL